MLATTVPMFQSTPVITYGRTDKAAAVAATFGVFQSTPVITDGRTPGAHPERPRHEGFNPRPSSLTGEPLGGVVLVVTGQVSIHARHH